MLQLCILPIKNRKHIARFLWIDVNIWINISWILLRPLLWLPHYTHCFHPVTAFTYLYKCLLRKFWKRYRLNISANEHGACPQRNCLNVLVQEHLCTTWVLRSSEKLCFSIANPTRGRSRIFKRGGGCCDSCSRNVRSHPLTVNHAHHRSCAPNCRHSTSTRSSQLVWVLAHHTCRLVS